MDWYLGNIERAAEARATGRMNAQANMIEQYAPQAAELMGHPGMAPTMGQDGLISGGVAATGLMAGNMSDPRTFLQMGTGLMSIPGYQQAGQQLMSQATASALGRPMEIARLAEQRRYNDAQIQMRQDQLQRDRAQMVGYGEARYKDMNQYVSAAGGIRDDARAELAPFRQQMSLYNTVQDAVAEKGFHGMSLADDELFIKSYAKMLLPNEAVMTEDISRIARSDKIEDTVLRGLAEKVNVGTPLSAPERQQLWQSMYRVAASAAPRYEQLRKDYTEFAERMYINPADVLNTAITMDTRRFAIEQKPGTVDEQTSNELDAKAREQNPTIGDRVGDAWNALTR